MTPAERIAHERALAATDARDVLDELAADPSLRDAYTLRALKKRTGLSYSVLQRIFDPKSGRALPEHLVAAIGPEFAARFYRRRLARLAAPAKPASDPRGLTLRLVIKVGHAAEEAEHAMANDHCDAGEWRRVAAHCGGIAADASRAESAALAAAALEESR